MIVTYNVAQEGDGQQFLPSVQRKKMKPLVIWRRTRNSSFRNGRTISDEAVDGLVRRNNDELLNGGTLYGKQTRKTTRIELHPSLNLFESEWKNFRLSFNLQTFTCDSPLRIVLCTELSTGPLHLPIMIVPPTQQCEQQSLQQ